MQLYSGDSNDHYCYLFESKRKVGGSFTVSASCTDINGRVVPICFDHRLFLPHTSFHHENRYELAWLSLSSSQLDSDCSHRHWSLVAWIGRWSSIFLVQTYRLRSLIWPSFCLRLVYSRTNHASCIADSDGHRLQFWLEISTRLSSQRNARDPNKLCEKIKRIAALDGYCHAGMLPMWISETVDILNFSYSVGSQVYPVRFHI